MKSRNLLISGITTLLIISVASTLWLKSIQATAEIESFPDMSTFDQNTGVEVPSTLGAIKFISTIKQDSTEKEDMVAFDGTGNGGIITQENDNFRTYTGMKLSKTPVAMLSYDITRDQKEDMISVLPAEWLDSKTWQRARIVEVGSDYLITDQLLRKNILTQATIIGSDGSQYSIKSNTGPTDDTPRNAIYLEKQLAPEENNSLADYRSLFSAGQYVSYLLPTKVISQNLQVKVTTNLGDYNFAPVACTPFIPQDIDTLTAVTVGQFGGDTNIDLRLTTHKTEVLSNSNVATAYNPDTHVLTFTISVPPSQIHNRNLTGSYISFTASPNKLLPIRQGTSNQLIVDITLPDTGEGVDAFQASLLPGDRFFLTSNTDETKKELIYKGDGHGCFTYSGGIMGTVLESSFGNTHLPNASEITTDPRSVITDLNANFLPIDSLAGRSLLIGSTNYDIEHNDQYHLYLAPAAGNISNAALDIIHNHTTTNYTIETITPTPTFADTDNLKVVTLVVDIPSSVQAVIGGLNLEGGKPMVRAIDIDQDGDKDIIYLKGDHIFLKKNNEISS